MNLIPQLFMIASLLAMSGILAPVSAQKEAPLLGDHPRVSAIAAAGVLPGQRRPDEATLTLERSRLSADLPLSGAALPLELPEMSETRSPWLFPMIGAAIGAGAGVVLGTHVMNSEDEWIAPPAHYVTIPLGTATGAPVGWLVDELVPR